jgi:hypothetical protein
MVRKGNKQPPDFKGSAKKLKRKGKKAVKARKAKRHESVEQPGNLA